MQANHIRRRLPGSTDRDDDSPTLAALPRRCRARTRYSCTRDSRDYRAARVGRSPPPVTTRRLVPGSRTVLIGAVKAPASSVVLRSGRLGKLADSTCESNLCGSTAVRQPSGGWSATRSDPRQAVRQHSSLRETAVGEASGSGHSPVTAVDVRASLVVTLVTRSRASSKT
jgi:hypothetical protein